jgi:hypothetical protein
MSKGIRLDKNLLRSKAFRSLKKWSLLVYLDFLRKRQWSQAKRGGQKIWVLTNNGEIVYPYLEAERKGINRREFRNALDELITKGFLDINHHGKGGRKKIDKNGRVTGDMTTYIISDRWKNYGKPNFKPPTVERRKDTRKDRGWAVYNKRQQKKHR